MSQKKRNEIRYKNDVVIKFMLGGENETSAYIRNSMLESILGFPIKKTTVKNTEIVPDNILGKKVILDVLVEDEDGVYYNIEMQTSVMTQSDELRYQKYGFQMISRQLQSGDAYTTLRKFYQIIFVSHIPKDSIRFIRLYKMQDEEGIEEHPYSIANRIYVHLPMINKMTEEVGFENLTSFEKGCYLLENNADNVILKTKDRLVKALMEKYEEMKNNTKWWSWADAIERGEAAAEMRFKEREEIARVAALQEGEIRGRNKGKLEGKYQMLELQLKIKYKLQDVSWVQNLSATILDELIVKVVICDTYEEFKQCIEEASLINT